MDNVTLLFGIMNGPGLMIQILDPGMLRIFDGPLTAFIDPSTLRLYSRFTIRIHNYIDTGLLKSLCEMRHEQLGSTVISRWNGNEWRRYKADFQSGTPVCVITKLSHG